MPIYWITQKSMFKFFKESIKEFDHVVWPTNKETKQYFNHVVIIITAFTLFLFVVWLIFSTWLFWAKDAVNPAKITTPTTSSSSNAAKNLNLFSWATNTWTAVTSNTGASSK